MNETPRSNQPTGRVFDVRRPGRTPAPATSRPVIVSNKPEVEDPMMNRPTPAHAPVPAPASVPATPLAQQPAQQQPEAISDERKPGAPAVSPQVQATLQEEPEALAHVVADAANALHPPEEPLLLSHNPAEISSDLSSDLNNTIAPEPASQTSSEVSAEKPASSRTASPEGVQPLPVHEDDLPDLHELSPLPTDHHENIPAGKAIVSHHRGNWKGTVLKALGILLLVALFAALIVDLLMDGGFIIIKHVPHTHFF